MIKYEKEAVAAYIHYFGFTNSDGDSFSPEFAREFSFDNILGGYVSLEYYASNFSGPSFGSLLEELCYFKKYD